MIHKISLIILFFFQAHLSAHGEGPFWGCKVERNDVIEKRAGLTDYPQMQYPVLDLEPFTWVYPENKVPIFLYDLWMHPALIEKYISSDALLSGKLATAFGVKRLYNADSSIAGFSNNFSARGRSAILNLIPDDSIDSKANGLVIMVDFSDLDKLVSMQTGYDLIPIVVMDWNNSTADKFCSGKSAMVVYTFSASNQPRNDVIYTDATLRPTDVYNQAAANASTECCKAFSYTIVNLFDRDLGLYYYLQFRKFWFHSTYFGDGTEIPCECDHFE